jgi:hypothetical protein
MRDGLVSAWINFSYLHLCLFCRREKEADEIQLVAAKAVNTSTEAYELARQAVNQQQNTRCVNFHVTVHEIFLRLFS